MLDSRQQTILEILLNRSDYITIKELSKLTKVSERTVRYDIEKLNVFLAENGVKTIEKKSGKGLKYSDKRSYVFLKKLSHTDNSSIIEPKERFLRILFNLLNSKEYVTIESLAKKLDVSLSTIKNDIKEIKAIIDNESVKISSEKGKGIKIIGNEYKIRTESLSNLSRETDTDIVFLENLFDPEIIENIKQCIHESESYLQYGLTDIQFNNLLLHIALAIRRIQLGKNILIDENNLNKLTQEPEFPVAADLAKRLETIFNIHIPHSEICYITTHFAASRLSKTSIDNDIELEILSAKIIKYVGDIYHHDFQKDSILYDNFTQHMQGLIYRCKKNIYLKNPLLHEIKDKNVKLYETVLSSQEIFQENNLKLSEDEMGFIYLHFLTALERFANRKRRRAKVLVACSSGIGTSMWIMNQLKKRFTFESVGLCAFHEIENILQNNEVDLLITTLPYKNPSLYTIVVTPNLKENHIKEIADFLSNFNTYNEDINTNEILSIVKKYCPEEKFEQLYEEINSVMHRKNTILEYPRLKELVSVENIMLGKDFNSVEEVLNTWAEAALERQLISRDYLNELIQQTLKYGDHIVLAPHIAMPHIYKDGEVKKSFIGIIKLDDGITIGKNNHRIKLLFVLITKDRKSHKFALQDILNIIENRVLLKKIYDCENKNKLYDIIQNLD